MIRYLASFIRMGLTMVILFVTVPLTAQNTPEVDMIRPDLQIACADADFNITSNNYLPVQNADSVFTAFFIGNSLTGDLNNNFKNVAERYMKTQGKTYSWGFFFRGSTVLPYFYAHPTDADMSSGMDVPKTPRQKGNNAPWNTALPGHHWDIVSMQPHGVIKSMGPNDLDANIEAANGIIASTRQNPANATTRFFIYGAWSDTSNFPMSYTASTIIKSNPGSTPCSQSRDFVELLCDRVRLTNPDVCMIPAGEVLYTLDSLMQRGKFKNLTSFNQFHRDRIHFNTLGQNIAAWVAYATIFKKSPVGLPYDNLNQRCVPPYSDVPSLNSHDLKLIQKTVWKVVKSKNKYTNVITTSARR